MLEHGRGGPLPPQPPRTRSGGGRRKLWWIGGGVAAAALLGAGAVGAWWYSATGPQPAEALPASTLGYASLDLDPSGGQKLDALRTLKKFPAIADEFGLDGDVGDIDVAQKVVELIESESGCEGLDYADDVEPWLGDRLAMGLVDAGEDEPVSVFVVQVTDGDAAEEGVETLDECAGGTSEPTGRVVVGDWMLVAQNQEIAEKVAEATEEGSLADDETFQRWIDEAGGAGIASVYAAPAAGPFIAEEVVGAGRGLGGPDVVYDGQASFSEELVEIPENPLASETPGEMPSPSATESPDWEPSEDPSDDGFGDDLDEDFDEDFDEELGDEELTAALEDFEGMAMTLRFDGGALELEMAGDAGVEALRDLTGDTGADAMSSLPDDTVAALGLGMREGWLGSLMDYVGETTGEDTDSLLEEAEAETGLELPEDVETLTGESAVLAIGPGLDFEEFSDPAGLPIALKVLGDTDAITEVLDDLRSASGAPDGILEAASEDGAVAAGLDEDWRDEVLGDGDLGGTEKFKSVIRDADDAGGVLYLDLDAMLNLIGSGLGDDDEVRANLEPLAALGMTSWVDDDVSHGVLRITTD
ncbi:DUF3352 domain-containing protein [Nocardioides pantholopis]|uniref:DUF3352 domain-containing protein n=1 Tax=Nocardioides pantholopis TaxID=2483798 RepID=UPI0013DE1C86|nr:DUF3352 domain-containing protein [Nocardioides pantholopis]